MTRYVNALLVFLMVLSAAAVYDMKYEAELAAARVAELDHRIAAERAEISLLKAEWSMLTQPARLEDLVDRYQAVLQLQPLTAEQIGTVADVPEKPPLEPAVPADGAAEDVLRSAAAGPATAADPAVPVEHTGSVR